MSEMGRLIKRIRQTDSVSSAGLEDMVLSALIKEQVEGLTPAAITLIPPRKFAVSDGYLYFVKFSFTLYPFVHCRLQSKGMVTCTAAQ